MLTCENCIHSSVCTPYNTPNDEYPNIGKCPHFKDKADYVEVVRCKDCEHCDSYYPKKAKGEEAKIAYYCKSLDCITKPTDFCNYGKKKGGAE